MGENKYVADYKRMAVFMASAGTAGSLVFRTTGSGLPSQAADTFLGVLDTTTVAGSYGVVETRGVFEFDKAWGTGVIEQGVPIYGSGASAVSTAQVTTGSVIGVTWEQSSSDKSTVAVMICGMNDKLM